MRNYAQPNQLILLSALVVSDKYWQLVLAICSLKLEVELLNGGMWNAHRKFLKLKYFYGFLRLHNPYPLK